MDRRLAYVALAIALAFAVALPLRRAWRQWSAATARVVAGSPAGPTNVVLIVMDTARQDRLSCYGYERETSPRLSELAESAATYATAYSTSSARATRT